MISFALGGLGPDFDLEGSNACPGMTTSPIVVHILATIRSASAVTLLLVFCTSWARDVSLSPVVSVGGGIVDSGVPFLARAEALSTVRVGLGMGARVSGAGGAGLSKMTVVSPLSLSLSLSLLQSLLVLPSE